MPVSLRKQHDPNKHPRYPKGTIINGVNVGGKFMPKSGGQAAIGRNKPVRAIAAKLASTGKVKARDANRRLMNAVARALKTHRAQGGKDSQDELRKVAKRAIANEVRAIVAGKPEAGRDRKGKKKAPTQAKVAASKNKKSKSIKNSKPPQVSIPKKVKLDHEFNENQLAALTDSVSRDIFDADSEKTRQTGKAGRQAHAARQIGLGEFLGGGSNYETSTHSATGKKTRDGLVEDVKNTMLWMGDKDQSDRAMDRISHGLVRASINKMTPAEHYQLLEYFPTGKVPSKQASETIKELRQRYGIGEGEQRQQMRSLRDLIKSGAVSKL